jgi:hypothetical protein
LVENPTPVKVTESPPVTVPYRGLIAVNKGVIEPSNVTLSLKVVLVEPRITFTGHL